jgi:9-cis-beta-carotene 9',10'-cleaving dioxygenase
MQAKPIHNTSPYISPPLIRPPPVHQASLAQTITKPKPISTPVPNIDVLVPDRVLQPVKPFIEHDDSIAASWDYNFLFMSQRSETIQPIRLRVAEGAIPTDFPSGAYYLTGPGIFKDDHGSTVHPLDGHGYLRAFTFDNVNREVKYMAKYIKTEAQVEEYDQKTDSWRFTHRGPFSVLKGGKKIGNTKVMKNVANTSVLMWGKKLLCMWEGGNPYEIESNTLDTIGKFNMMGDLEDDDDDDDDDENHGGDVWEVAANLLKPILYGTY